MTLFGSLLEDLRLNQVSTMAALVYQKLKVIDLLESTCSNTSNIERDVHDIFDKWLNRCQRLLASGECIWPPTRFYGC
jgi:hypothetical protein